MIQVGDLVKYKDKNRRKQTKGVWLVVELADWRALCAQGGKRMWLWIERLEKL